MYRGREAKREVESFCQKKREERVWWVGTQGYGGGQGGGTLSLFLSHSLSLYFTRKQCFNSPFALAKSSSHISGSKCLQLESTHPTSHLFRIPFFFVSARCFFDTTRTCVLLLLLCVRAYYAYKTFVCAHRLACIFARALFKF